MITDNKNANAKDPPIPVEVTKEITLLATITKVVKGKHGFYAVAISSFDSQEICITFSLEKEVLEEDIALTPHVLQQLPGISVVLSNIVKKEKGWRALHARFYKPSDEGQIFARQNNQHSDERRSEHGP